MLRFLVRRLTAAGVILALTSLLSYSLLYLAPGDPAVIILARRIGRLPSAEEAAAVRVAYGLDQPPLVQYLRWAGQALRGDLGRSIRTGVPVVEELALRLGPSLLLAGTTTLFALLLGIPLGMLAALREHTWWAQLARGVALTSVALPNFWLAFLLVLVFAVQLRWLPSYGLRGPQHLILPVLALGLSNAAYVSRLTRSLLLEVRYLDYMRTAQAKGLGDLAVWLRHALPNVAIPLITVAAAQFSQIAAGAVIIETLFAWPGLGPYYVNAVNYRDIPVIQAMVLLFAALFVLTNLATDIAYSLLDPRIRLK